MSASFGSDNNAYPAFRFRPLAPGESPPDGAFIITAPDDSVWVNTANDPAEWPDFEKPGIPPCGVTVLRSPLVLTKQISPGETKAASGAKHFDAEAVEITDLDALRDLIATLIDDPHACIVRGALIDPSHTKHIRRVLHGEHKTLREEPRRWVALDIEGITRPDHIPATDLERCALHVIPRLPAAFHHARCIVQASANHGRKSDIRLRLWYWLDRPVSGDELRRWFAGTSGVDPVVFSPAFIIYTARPLFLDGALDPCPQRLAELPGAACVSVPSVHALAEPKAVALPAVANGGPVPDGISHKFINAVLNRVRRAAEGQKHNALLRAAISLGGVLDQLGITDAQAEQWLIDALPNTVRDWEAARKTIRDGLAIGRQKPIPLGTGESGKWNYQTLSGPPQVDPDDPGPDPDAGSGAGARPQRKHRTAKDTLLPAYYPAPTEDTATAKARQDVAMNGHMRAGLKIVRARQELHDRHGEEIAKTDAVLAANNADALSPAEKAAVTRQLHREIAEREGWGKKIPLPPRHMFSGSQGTGKTTVARQFAADGPPIVTWITETNFDKSEEEYQAYLREPGTKAPAMLIRGRDREDPKRPGHLMCERNRAAHAIAEADYSVPELLCLKCPFNGNKKQGHHQECGDHRQRREARELIEAGNGATFFLAANYIFLPAPVPTPQHAILDESIIGLAIAVHDIPVGDLVKLSIPNIDTQSFNTADTLDAIIDAFCKPFPTSPERRAAGDDRNIPRPLDSLRFADCTDEALRDLAKAVSAEMERNVPPINARMTDDEIETALWGGDRHMLRSVLALISALRAEINLPREEAVGVWEEPLSGVPTIRVARVRKPRGLKDALVTVLDGTGKLGPARKIFGDRLEETCIRFERQAYVIGTRNKSYSKSSITGEDRDGKPIASKTKSSARLRDEIGAIYQRMPAGTVLGATKRVEEKLFDAGIVPNDTPSMHFHKLRGRNAWEHYPGALIIGAENISIIDLEAMARGFFATDPAPFVSMREPAPQGWRYEHQWPYRATRMRRMRNGTLSPVEVPVHPDPRVQEILETIREDEVVQAIDRLRPVWNRRQFALLNSLCIDVTYDRIYLHRHLAAGGDPVERAYLATGWVPFTPADLHAAHKAIFRTPKAAEYALRNYPINPKENLIWDCGGVSYRRLGQRGPLARGALDRGRYPTWAAALAAVEAANGPLAWFDGMPVPQAHGAPGSPSRQPAGPWAASPPPPSGSGAAPASVLVHGPPVD
jgi:hypothetical protein